MKDIHAFTKTMLSELDQVLSQVDELACQQAITTLNQADAVFCAGAGRSGFHIKGFAMRLMHLGMQTYVVGETTTPSIAVHNVLVIGSGSGSTNSLVNHARKAKEVGAKIILITIDETSPIAKLADTVIAIAAPSPKAKVEGNVASIQPMGSLFEQSEGLLFDAMIMMLMEERSMTSTNMFAHHANME